jgi:ribosomal protein S12 methylthiotransferase
MARSTIRRAGLPVLGAGTTALPAVTVEPSADAPRVALVTLGCDKNTVDSERLLARLASGGARVTSDAFDADVIVINTCGFIDVAKEESIDAILDAVRLKQEGRVRAVVAMGCMVQRYKSDLEMELPEVDLFLGLTEAERLVPELRTRGLLRDVVQVPTMEQPLRLLSTSTRHTSHLKISEGCDHTCAFCAIPLMRGKHRSAPIELLVKEAQQLESLGVVELNLISQDTTWYGRDILRGADTDGAEWFIGKTFAGMARVEAGARITTLE